MLSQQNLEWGRHSSTPAVQPEPAACGTVTLKLEECGQFPTHLDRWSGRTITLDPKKNQPLFPGSDR